MTTEELGPRFARVRLRALCMLLLAGCPLPPPPAPEPIECEQIERAEERFPEECGDAEDPDADAAPSDGELEAGAQ